MVVIAIVGLLAAVALPSYEQYITRAKATEMITHAASFQAEIGAYVVTKGRFPEKPMLHNPTDLIDKIEFWRPSCSEMWIHVYPTKKFHSSVKVGRHAFIYRGVVNDDRSVTWQCTFHPTFRKLPGEFFPSTCAEEILKDVRAKKCR